MEHTTVVSVDAPAETVRAVLADLATHPHWNDLVAAATPAPADEGDSGPAWLVTLRAPLGPFARSKQLRMVRRADGTGGTPVRFERREVDSFDHADWVMEATIGFDGATSSVSLSLSYGGGLWTSALDGVLRSAIQRATRRLPEFVASH